MSQSNTQLMDNDAAGIKSNKKNSAGVINQQAIGADLDSGLTTQGSPLLPSSYAVNLDFFSGPLDLLLHLVQQKEVAVEDVEMAEIAEQYLCYVDSASNLDLEKATEFLVVAAVLVQIKSKKLLQEEANVDDEIAVDYDESFYEELRQRLKKYEKNKQRAQRLAAMPQQGVDCFVRLPEKAEFNEDAELEASLDSFGLGKMFFGLLKRVGDNLRTYKVQMDSVSVVDYMMRTIDIVQASAGSAGSRLSAEGNKESKPSSFFSILKTFVGRIGRESPLRLRNPGERRGVVIGSFISLLELMKRGAISVDSVDESMDYIVRPAYLSADIEIESSSVEEPGVLAGPSSTVGFESGSESSNVVELAEYLNHKLVSQGDAVNISGGNIPGVSGNADSDLKKVNGGGHEG